MPHLTKDAINSLYKRISDQLKSVNISDTSNTKEIIFKNIPKDIVLGELHALQILNTTAELTQKNQKEVAVELHAFYRELYRDIYVNPKQSQQVLFAIDEADAEQQANKDVIESKNRIIATLAKLISKMEEIAGIKEKIE